ncbi:MAG: hypothetical protein EAX96_16285 [Candidatus Lokiarchaeota archaeon]|nr:hypothetical protein [Candidatus Lokiarchaeota archaeon]
MRDIDEIWIVDGSGVTLFNISKGGTVDPTLLGGFFSSLNLFISQIGEKKLNSLSLGDSKIMLYQGKLDLMFISRSRKDVKEKEITEHLKTIEKRFIKLHEDKIKKWDGNTSYFENFGDFIEDIFKDSPERRIQESLW